MAKAKQSTPKQFVCALRITFLEDVTGTSGKCAEEIEYIAQFDAWPETLVNAMIQQGNWIRTFSSTTEHIPPEIAKRFQALLQNRREGPH